MKISFCCDHGGFIAKEAVFNYLKSKGHEVVDFGTFSDESCDYPDYAYPTAEAVGKGECDFGILICGTGIGMSICANKVKGVRCANVFVDDHARLARLHNNANVIAFGARFLSFEQASNMLKIFLETEFEGNRHCKRVDLLDQYK